MTVEKLMQYRDVMEGSQLSQMTQLTKVQGGIRPPERQQYDQYGKSSALHIILDNPVRPLFDFLMNLKLSMHQQNVVNMTPFFKLVKQKDIKAEPYKYCFEEFLKHNADVNTPDEFGVSAFWFFYNNNKMEEAFFLVDNGGNINHMDNFGMYALKKEVMKEDIPMITKLLDKGADPNITDEFQRTVLHHAVNMGH